MLAAAFAASAVDDPEDYQTDNDQDERDSPRWDGADVRPLDPRCQGARRTGEGGGEPTYPRCEGGVFTERVGVQRSHRPGSLSRGHPATGCPHCGCLRMDDRARCAAVTALAATDAPARLQAKNSRTALHVQTTRTRTSASASS